jgi:hypothetical protein
MNITREEVDAAIEENVEWFLADDYIEIIHLIQHSDGIGMHLNHGIQRTRESGVDLSWFDENYPYEMNHPLTIISEEDFQNSTQTEREIWGRVAGVATSIYNSLD